MGVQRIILYTQRNNLPKETLYFCACVVEVVFYFVSSRGFDVNKRTETTFSYSLLQWIRFGHNINSLGYIKIYNWVHVLNSFVTFLLLRTDIQPCSFKETQWGELIYQECGKLWWEVQNLFTTTKGPEASPVWLPNWKSGESLRLNLPWLLCTLPTFRLFIC